MKKAIVFILLGQSNAVGHALPMEENDKIKKPLKNVFGLTRKLNQSFDNDALTWSGYTSSEMNLGETQDDTYSVANLMAKDWQDRIDNGENLPDLYIIHIAIGAQGVAENGMWYPEREKKLIPGPLSQANISLCPFTEHILFLVNKSFEDIGVTPEFMGLHWRGGEQDTLVSKSHLEEVLKNIYERIFEKFYSALGKKIPVILHKITHEERSKINGVLDSFYYINQVFEKLEEENENVKIFDVKTAPFYDDNLHDKGILQEDLVHYTRKTNAWVAEKIILDYLSKK